VLVIGGGPSGLEAARVAALRGHRVTLCEADRDLGGNMRWSRRFPDRQTIWDGIDWLIREIDRLGVEVYRNSTVDDATIAAIDPDVIVVATGGRPPDDAGELTSIDVARMERPPAGVNKVAIVDRFGAYESIGVAETFIRWGIDVEIVTPHKMLAPKIMPEQVVAPARERMANGPGRFTARTGWDPAEGVPAADVVMVIDRVANPLALGDEAIAGREVHHIGDAAQPGNLWAAIRTGNAVGRAV